MQDGATKHSLASQFEPAVITELAMLQIHNICLKIIPPLFLRIRELLELVLLSVRGCYWASKFGVPIALSTYEFISRTGISSKFLHQRLLLTIYVSGLLHITVRNFFLVKDDCRIITFILKKMYWYHREKKYFSRVTSIFLETIRYIL